MPQTPTYLLVAEAHGIGTHYCLSLVADEERERYVLTCSSGPGPAKPVAEGPWLFVMDVMAKAVAAELAEEGFPPALVGKA